MTAKGNFRVSSIVLAAGRSARMGEAKQLLHLGERTVLEQTLENVRRSRVDEIVLVLGFSSETIRQQLPARLLDGMKVVVNKDFAQGMASSLRAGLLGVVFGDGCCIDCPGGSALCSSRDD